MPYISWYSPQDFLKIVAKFEEGTPDTIIQFPLEYYASNDSIRLYKQVMSKIFGTKITVNDNGMFLFKGKEVTFNVLIDELKVNNSGKQLTKPLEYDNNLPLKITRL